MSHRLDHGVNCHHSLLLQVRTTIGSSGNRNGGIGRNDCGVAVETEAVVEAATLAVAGASNNGQKSGGGIKVGSSQQSTKW